MVIDDNDALIADVLRISGQDTVPIILWGERVEVGIDGERG